MKLKKHMFQSQLNEQNAPYVRARRFHCHHVDGSCVHAGGAYRLAVCFRGDDAE